MKATKLYIENLPEGCDCDMTLEYLESDIVAVQRVLRRNRAVIAGQTLICEDELTDECISEISDVLTPAEGDDESPMLGDHPDQSADWSDSHRAKIIQ